MHETIAYFQTVLVAALAVLGHATLLIFLINRIHATGVNHRLIKLIDVVWYLGLFGVPVVIVVYLWQTGPITIAEAFQIGQPLGSLSHYIIVMILIAPVSVARWLSCKRRGRDTPLLVSNHTEMIDAVGRLGRVPTASLRSRLAASLPGNQVFQIAVSEKTLELPKLDSRLDGLRLTHLSDLHFTGQITEDFFHLIVDLANDWPADLVVISGDIIDKWRCFDWLARVLGRIESQVATCFVLGNHDLRIRNERGLRSALTGLGMIDLGKRTVRVQVRDCDVLLSGNELPWFRPAGDPASQSPADFQIAVCHTPDQINWARRLGVDLMLAGHTHGGQIRLPVIGPVFSPSRYGVRYSAGTFHQPPTVMHVSRGLSGTRPLRFNCTPELARLVLRVGPADNVATQPDAAIRPTTNND